MEVPSDWTVPQSIAGVGRPPDQKVVLESSGATMVVRLLSDGGLLGNFVEGYLLQLGRDGIDVSPSSIETFATRAGKVETVTIRSAHRHVRTQLLYFIPAGSHCYLISFTTGRELPVYRLIVARFTPLAT